MSTSRVTAPGQPPSLDFLAFMKAAFIGTHGVGKTTLAYGLAMRLKQLGASVGFLEEVARRCPFPINEDTSLEAQTWILMETIRREIELAKIYEDVVCDRSVVDNYCYLEFGMGRRQALFDLVRYWADTYDLLVKVPVRQGLLQDDGTRSTDRAFQSAIDETLDGLVIELGLEVRELEGLDEVVDEARLLTGRLPLA